MCETAFECFCFPEHGDGWIGCFTKEFEFIGINSMCWHLKTFVKQINFGIFPFKSCSSLNIVTAKVHIFFLKKVFVSSTIKFANFPIRFKRAVIEIPRGSFLLAFRRHRSCIYNAVSLP